MLDAEYVRERMALVAPAVVARALARWLVRLRAGEVLRDAEWIGLKALFDTAMEHDRAMRCAPY
jgi:hypothetical protein